MAAFLSRAQSLPDSIDGSSSSTTTPRSSRTGSTGWPRPGSPSGCNPPANTNFCPTANVTRGQMAAFIIRALAGGVTPPPRGPDRNPPPPTPVPQGSATTSHGDQRLTARPALPVLRRPVVSAWTSKAGWRSARTRATGPVSPATRRKRVTQLILNAEAPNDPGNNLSGSIAGCPREPHRPVRSSTSHRTRSEGASRPASGKLKKLTALDLSGNFLTGTIPSHAWRPHQSLGRAGPAQQPLTGGLPDQLHQPERLFRSWTWDRTACPGDGRCWGRCRPCARSISGRTSSLGRCPG